MIRFILNPAAGPARRRVGVRGRLETLVAEAPGRFELAVTRHPGHAVDLAADAAARGHTAAVAVGGDGTVNEVAQGLVGTGCALGLLPQGSGNGLARHLRVPGEMEAALALVAAASPPVRKIDTGTAAGRFFVNVFGLGLDAEIARRFATSGRRGLSAYLAAGWPAVRRRRATSWRVDWEGGARRLDATWLSIGNGAQYGNGAIFAPGARLDDGQLDLVAVGAVGWTDAASLAARLFLGGFDRHPSVWRVGSGNFQIGCAGPGWMHTDGEVHPVGPEVTVTVRPRSLRVIAPQSQSRSRSGAGDFPAQPLGGA